jgi:hypothetical protein
LDERGRVPRAELGLPIAFHARILIHVYEKRRKYMGKCGRCKSASAAAVFEKKENMEPEDFSKENETTACRMLCPRKIGFLMKSTGPTRASWGNCWEEYISFFQGPTPQSFLIKRQSPASPSFPAPLFPPSHHVFHAQEARKRLLAIV